jgi:hypothetical protein
MGIVEVHFIRSWPRLFRLSRAATGCHFTKGTRRINKTTVKNMLRSEVSDLLNRMYLSMIFPGDESNSEWRAAASLRLAIPFVAFLGDLGLLLGFNDSLHQDQSKIRVVFSHVSILVHYVNVCHNGWFIILIYWTLCVVLGSLIDTAVRELCPL